MIGTQRTRRFALAVGAATVIPLGLIAAAPAAQGAPATQQAATQQTGPEATSAPYKGRVTANPSLIIRKAPTPASSRVGTIRRGTVIGIQCKVYGPSVRGNALWYKLAGGKWVTARYVDNIGSAPRFCGNGSEYTGKVVSRTSLAIRSGPNTANIKVSSAPRGQRLPLICKVRSQYIDGNSLWYQLTGDGGGQWVTARYVSNIGSAPPYC